MKNPLIFEPKSIRRSRAECKGKKAYYKYLRNEASNYIKRKAVREFVLKRDGYKCKICGSTENLQIDHIKSVRRYGFTMNVNTIDNLQVLCRSCNAGKEV